MRVEAVGNYYRSKEWQLDENQLARMADLGWARPNECTVHARKWLPGSGSPGLLWCA
jgi:hypothetical protein